MADFVTAEGLRKLKARHPDAAVVTYVNSSAEVKAESDICCTSANAVQVTESIPANRPIIFVPDRNLAQWVIEQTGRDNIIPWEGYCHVHDDMVLDELMFAKEDHPNALVVIHPEETCYLQVTPDDVPEIVSTTLKGTGVVDRLLYHLVRSAGDDPNRRRRRFGVAHDRSRCRAGRGVRGYPRTPSFHGKCDVQHSFLRQGTRLVSAFVV